MAGLKDYTTQERPGKQTGTRNQKAVDSAGCQRQAAERSEYIDAGGRGGEAATRLPRRPPISSHTRRLGRWGISSQLLSATPRLVDSRAPADPKQGGPQTLALFGAGNYDLAGALVRRPRLGTTSTSCVRAAFASAHAAKTAGCFMRHSTEGHELPPAAPIWLGLASLVLILRGLSRLLHSIIDGLGDKQENRQRCASLPNTSIVGTK